MLHPGAMDLTVLMRPSLQGGWGGPSLCQGYGTSHSRRSSSRSAMEVLHSMVGMCSLEESLFLAASDEQWLRCRARRSCFPSDKRACVSYTHGTHFFNQQADIPFQSRGRKNGGGWGFRISNHSTEFSILTYIPCISALELIFSQCFCEPPARQTALKGYRSLWAGGLMRDSLFRRGFCGRKA